MTNEEYINQIIEIGNTLQIHPNSPKGQTLKKCIELLSAVPEREKGEWIQDKQYEDVFTCSQCNEPFLLYEGTPKDNYYNFCPNCGADMRGE